MVENEDGLTKFVRLSKKYSERKNLIGAFVFFFVLFFVNLSYIYLKAGNLSLIGTSVLFFTNVAFVLISFFILYGVVKWVLPLIEKGKMGFKTGKIWVFLGVHSDTPLFFINLQRYVYNTILFSFVFIILFGLLYFMLLTLWLPFIFVFSFFFPTDLSYFPVVITILNLDIAVLLMILSLSKGGLLSKKSVMLFLFSELKKFNSLEKKLFVSKLFKFMSYYSFSTPLKNTKFFSRKLIGNIALYYQNVAMVLLDHDKVYNQLFPELKELLSNDDYEGLLSHLKKLDGLCKKKKGYEEHILLIKSLNKDISSEEVIEFSSQLKGLKIKTKNEGNLKRSINFIEMILFNKLFWVLVVLVFLGLLSIGIIDEEDLARIKPIWTFFRP